MQELRQSTTVTIQLGPFVDSTDGEQRRSWPGLAFLAKQNDIKPEVRY